MVIEWMRSYFVSIDEQRKWILEMESTPGKDAEDF